MGARVGAADSTKPTTLTCLSEVSPRTGGTQDVSSAQAVTRGCGATAKRRIDSSTERRPSEERAAKSAVMSSLFVVSLCFTLGGAFLLFFSENILTVLWPSIGLVIIGSSLTVLTVMPGAGRWIVQHIRLIKSSSKVCWLNNLCRECVRNLGKSTTDPVHRMESTGDSR